MKITPLTTNKKTFIIKKAVRIGVIVASTLSLTEAALRFTEASSIVVPQEVIANGDNAPVIVGTSPSIAGSSAQDWLQSPAGSSAQERLQSPAGSTAQDRLQNPIPSDIFEDFFGKDESGKWIPLDPHEVIEHIQLLYPAPADQANVSSGTDYRIISVIPAEEIAFQNIFHSDLSLSAKSEMAKYHRAFDGLNNSTILESAKQGESDFYHLLKQSKQGEIIIIIGHSEEINSARHLILPDGQAIMISNIHRTCLDLGATCLILTCYSEDFSLGNMISLGEAYQMIREGIGALEAAQRGDASVPKKQRQALHNGSLTQSEFLIYAMRRARISHRASRFTMIGITTVAGGGGIYMAVSKYKVGDR